MNTSSGIEPVKFWCQKVLPLVYDNSLSYYEVLCKLVDYLNQVIDALNTQDEDLKQYVDNAISNLTENWLKTVYNILNSYTNEFDEKLENQNQDLQNQIAEQTALLSGAIQNLNVAYQNADDSLKIYFNNELQKLKELIPTITSVFVVSPITGQLVPIQQALDEITNTLRYGALTAFQYDGLQLTAEQYDNEGLTAFEYDFYGLCILWKYWPAFKMHSPFTGEFVPVQWIVNALAQEHRVNGVTAQSYDNRELTAQEYDVLDYTAYSYDWQYSA